MLKIGEFSSLAKMTVKTIRFYSDVGLLTPAFVDDNGYRYYETEQLNDLLKIKELRSLDLSIEDIKSIYSEAGTTSEILKKHLESLENEEKRLKHNIATLKKYMANAQKGEIMQTYKATLIQIPEYIAYYRHGVIPTMADLTNFVLQAGSECRQNNPTLECEDYCFVTYSAKEYKETDVELEYVEAVKTLGKESANIKFKTIPACKAISVIHKGGYDKLGNAYAFALSYVKNNGLVMADDIREVYIDGCWNKDSEDDYTTEIQIPVK